MKTQIPTQNLGFVILGIAIVLFVTSACLRFIIGILVSLALLSIGIFLTMWWTNNYGSLIGREKKK